jgi:hypothetical protein
MGETVRSTSASCFERERESMCVLVGVQFKKSGAGGGGVSWGFESHIPNIQPKPHATKQTRKKTKHARTRKVNSPPRKERAPLSSSPSITTPPAPVPAAGGGALVVLVEEEPLIPYVRLEQASTVLPAL